MSQGVVPRGGRVGPRQPELVGREQEIAELRLWLSGPPAVVLLEGEAGIGKSRLLRELLVGLESDGRVIPVAACPPFRESLTLGPIVDALRQTTTGVRGLGLSALAGALRPVFPEWGEDLPPLPEPLAETTAARHRLFRALAELVDRLGVEVLVVEDVHWADEVTLEFLLFLTARSSRALSLVLTYRPEDLPDDSLVRRLSSRVPAGTTHHRMPIDALDLAATARLVSSMLEDRELSPAFAQFIYERTEGVPLAVEELVRLMHDRADLTHRRGEWLRRHLDDIAVPPTIRDAVLERIARLEPEALAVLQAAAVLADPADEATLALVTGLPAERVRTGLVRSLGSGLLAEDQRRLVAFRHALHERAVYESIPPPFRRDLHRRAGEALEDGTSEARLARHFREAGDTGRWCRHAERAADLALVSGDDASAGRLLHELITLAELPAATVVRLLDKLPYVSFTGMPRHREIVDTLRRILGSGLSDRRVEAEIRYHLGRLLILMEEETDAGRAELERAVTQLTHDPVRASRAMLTLGWPHGAAWPASTHREWLRRAAEGMTAVAPADRLRMTVERANALLLLGDPAGWADAAEIPDDAGTAEEWWEISRGNLNIGNVAILWGRYAEAERRLRVTLELAERRSHLRVETTALVNQLHLDYFTGAWDGLTDRARRLAGSEDVQPLAKLEAMLVIGLLEAANDATKDAEEHLKIVQDGMRRRAAEEWIAAPAAALAQLWLADDRLDDALALTREPIDIIAHKETWLWATDLVPVRVDALIAAGRLGEAAELVTEFARGLRGVGAPGPSAGLATAEAILAEGRGEPMQAAAAFAAAATAWDDLPRPYDALLARERQAGCLLAAGEAEAGIALLSTAFQGLSDLGARGAAVRVMNTLRRNGVEVRRPWWGGRQSYGDRLSPRELEVVRLVVRGRTNPQIADELFLSPKTVARHVNSAMRKLDVSTRTALAVQAVQAGLVPRNG
ncbi:AAA family ATPase [Plantactinospora sp. B6F1]|uniref:ATP-binding protein n=1 Tax=Plantactinospora sp. B6F1 TaxID=3158971 RepID=UPI0032D8E5AD